MTVATGSAPRHRRIPFVARIVAAMILGIGAGTLLGDRGRRLGDVGTVVIDLIKALAGPLLFLAVVDTFLRSHLDRRSAVRMLTVSAINGALALGIGLGLSNALRPGDRLDTAITRPVFEGKAGRPAAGFAVKPIDFVEAILGYVPKSVVRPFLDNSVISIILLALLCGWALRKVKDEQEARGEVGYRAVEGLVTSALRAVEVMLGGVLTLVPIAVFCVVAKTVGHDGFRPLAGLAVYVGVAVLGLAIQVLVVYQLWLVLVAKVPLAAFWSGARDAVVYALGASSSLATLPVTLKCLEKMKVSPQAARMAACVGTNFNNDGILLYEAMAVLFVAQVYGIHLTMPQQLLAAVSCVIAGVGIAAVPDAGLISLTLVLATIGLPLEIVPLLLTVDWLLSRCRAATNVTSDLVVAVVLDRMERWDRQASATAERMGPEAEKDLAPAVLDQ